MLKIGYLWIVVQLYKYQFHIHINELFQNASAPQPYLLTINGDVACIEIWQKAYMFYMLNNINMKYIDTLKS